MRSAVARLIRSSASASPSRLSLSPALLKSGNAFSSNGMPSNAKHINEPFKVEDAETVKVPPLCPDKLLVLGGSGFVGSHVCKEALDRGLFVSSLNRSGKPSISESWAEKVVWNQGNLLEPASLKDAINDVSTVVSCVGGFGSNSFMYKINGTANINAVRAAAEKGVKRFVYVSAADFGLVNYLLQGYYEGKTRPLGLSSSLERYLAQHVEAIPSTPCDVSLPINTLERLLLHMCYLVAATWSCSSTTLYCFTQSSSRV